MTLASPVRGLRLIANFAQLLQLFVRAVLADTRQHVGDLAFFLSGQHFRHRRVLLDTDLVDLAQQARNIGRHGPQAVDRLNNGFDFLGQHNF